MPLDNSSASDVHTPVEHDTPASLSVIEQLQRDELARLLPLCLAIYALFSLGYSVWHYQIGDASLALVLGVSGALSVMLLVVFQLAGTSLLTPIRVVFYLMLAVMGHLFLVLCKIDQVGMIGVLCMVPGLVLLCGKIVGSWMLAVNLLVIAAAYQGWLPWQLDGYSDAMWTAFWGSYAGLGIFVIGVEYLRDHSRRRLVDITQQYDRIATLDPLTELPNRKELERLLGPSVNSFHLSGEPFSIILGDVDNIKQINEQHGSQFGDQLLQVVGKALLQGLRTDDMAARWGGDQFLILLRGQKQEAAMQVAERLRRNVAIQRLPASGEPVGVTISFGVATIKANDSSDELVATAERGLYQAKHMGKDMVVVG